MALLTDFFIQSYVDSGCNIVVSDITVYPYGVLARTGVALCIFWDSAAFVGPNIEGADNSNPNQYDIQAIWTIDPVNGNTYSIRIFLAPLWTAGAYAGSSMVFYNGSFWYADPGGLPVGPTDVPGVSAKWLPVSVGTQAEINTAWGYFVLADAVNLIGYVDESVAVACDDFTVIKTACYQYTITDNTDDSAVKTITVYNYGTNEQLLQTTIDPASGLTASIDLTTYGDGVYTVLVAWNCGGNRCVSYLVIYEYCSLWNCYQQIFQALACGTYNPCCTTCDPEVLKNMENYRESLNILTGFMFNIWAYINVERVAYMGIFSIDETRDEYISRVYDYIIKAKELMTACDWCEETDTETDNPCDNCP